jgi:streptogramin lyase
MDMRLLFTLLFSGCLGISAQAQNSLSIGQWRSHLPYNLGRVVTQSAEKIYFATEWSIVTVDKVDESVDFVSKVDGLSNVGIQLIRYNPGSETLIVVYTNSVIDLVKPDGVFTMNQIRNFDNLVGEKTIYDIFIENDSTALLGTSYGVSRINTNRNEFAFTTFTGIPVRGVHRYNEQIYLATDEGLYRAGTNNINLADFSQWEYLDQNEGFPLDYSSRHLASYQGNLYADINDTVFVISEQPLQKFQYEEGYEVAYLSAEGNHFLIGLNCISGCSGPRVKYVDANGQEGFIAQSCVGRPVNAVEDEQGRIWFGDGFRGYRRVNQLDDENCTVRNYNSPYSEDNREFAIYDNQLWMVAGGVNQTFSNRFLDHGFASFIDGRWSIYNRFTRDELKGPLKDDPSDDMLDFLTITVHPDNGIVYAGSFYEGLIEFDGETMIQYDENNSTLGNAVGDASRTRISGLAFDEENNLWVSNHSAERPLSVLKADGTWQSFAPSCRQEEIHQLEVDQNGFKWMVVNNSVAGVILFDEGELDNPSDDRCRTFTANNSNLPTNNTNCLTVDLEGDVWVGTTEGVVIFECGANAFDNICQGTRRIVEQDGFGAFLLETEEVQTIAVDGANRKWIGTQNGVFVLSPSGDEQIAHFTEANSPLFDNNIIDIEVNPQNGEVFIGTDKGVISYLGEAIEGGQVNNSTIEIYPNPVRPEYQGTIAIRGLARDANVKITDIHGRLVFETTALGGQAIWDGFDYNGRRADSGVYLVFSTSNARFTGFTAKPSAAVGKILFVK